jgi:hypothetical protein
VLRYRSIPDPPKYIDAIITYIQLYKKYFRRYLGLPRPRLLTHRAISEHPDPITGRYQVNLYEAYPYYVKPTKWKRWNPVAILRFLTGGDRPGDDPLKYKPDGYRIMDLGPEKYEGKGREWMEEDLRKGREVVPSGASCPFGFGTVNG